MLLEGKKAVVTGSMRYISQLFVFGDQFLLAGEQLFEDAQGAMRDLLVSLPFSGLSRQKITEFQTRLPDLQ